MVLLAERQTAEQAELVQDLQAAVAAVVVLETAAQAALVILVAAAAEAAARGSHTTLEQVERAAVPE
jgi:hypothetical protein